MPITLPDAPTPEPQKPRLVDGLKPQVVPEKGPQTAVDTVEEAIGSGVQRVVESPLGRVINPVLEGMNYVYKKGFEPALESLSATALTPVLQDRNPQLTQEQAWRAAREYANEISLGQSTARLPFFLLRGTLQNLENPDSLPEFMQPDHNILDEEERDLAYKSQFAGWAASSLLDLGAIIGTEKAFGPAWRAGKAVVLGRNSLRTGTGAVSKVDKGDLAKFESRLDKVQAWADGGQQGPMTGDAYLIKELVESNDPIRLARNPFIANPKTANVDRSIAIISGMTDYKSVINFLKAERGNRQALRDLWDTDPIAADSLDNFGVRFKPIEDMSQIHALPSVQRSQKLRSVFDKWVEKNPNFARAIDDFIAEVESGAGLTTYASRQSLLGRVTGGRLGTGRLDAAMDRLTVPLGTRKALSQFGFVENDGVFGKLYENGPFQRAIRVIYMPTRARRKAEINISNPRSMETAWQIMSELNRVRALSTPKGTRWKQDAIRAYVRARTDTERAAVFEKIEQGAMVKIAQSYGVEGMTGGQTTSKALRKQMEDFYKGLNRRRSDVRKQWSETGVIEDADHVLNVRVGPRLRSTEPSTVPMLDLAGLERAAIISTRRGFKDSTPGSWRGKTKPSGYQYGRARAGEAIYNAGQFFDVANMFFSNNVLLRLAYIPPNVIIDPVLRASMDTESLFMTREMFPGLANVVYNNTQRVMNGVYRARTYGSRRSARRDLQAKINDELRLEKNIAKAENSIAKRKAAGEDVTKAEERLIKQRERLVRLGKKTAQARKEVSRYTNEIGRRKANRAALGSGRQAVIRRVDGKVLPRLVADDRMWEFEVNGQRFQVLDVEDPNVKGVRSYQTEYDGFQSFLQASRTSERADRARLMGGERAVIKPGAKSWDNYIDAVARFANRNIRNELGEVGGMILQGRSRDYILDWLSSSGGAEYRARIFDMLPKDMKTPDGLGAWLDRTINDVSRMFPDPDMRKTILQRDITVQEVDSYLAGRSDLPALEGRVIDPNQKVTKSRAIREGVINGVLFPTTGFLTPNAQELAWRAIGNMETRIARAPLFRRYVREEMREQIAAAQRAGIKVDSSVVSDRIRQVAYRRALNRVENTMYSVRNLTNAGWSARYLMAFPQAFFNSQIVAARLLWQNPANALYYMSVMDAYDGLDVIVDDEGNEYKSIKDVPNDVDVKVRFPMRDVLGNMPVVGGVLGDAFAEAEKSWYNKDGQGGTFVNPRMMEFMLADPSVSWLANISLSAIVSHIVDTPFMKVNGPEIAAWMRENLGNDVYERSIFYGGEPLDVSGLDFVKGAMLSGAQNSRLNVLGMSLGATEPTWFTGVNYASRISAGIKMDAEMAMRQGREPASPDEIIRGQAYSEFIRAAVQFGWWPNIVIEPRTSALMGLYANLYKANNNDSDAAENEFVRLVGYPALAQLASSYEKTAGTPSTMRAARIVAQEEGLLRQIERTTGSEEFAGFLFQSYGSEEDEFVGEARAFLRSNSYPGTGEQFLARRDAAELQDAALIRVGWYEFDQLQNWQASEMSRLGITSTSKKRYTTSGLKAEYDARLEQLKQNVPWLDQYNTRRETFWEQQFPAFVAAVSDERFMARQQDRIPVLRELEDWVSNMEILYNSYRAATTETATDTDNKYAKEAMLEWHSTFVNNSSSDFQEFASRWLNFPEQGTQLEQQLELMMGR